MTDETYYESILSSWNIIGEEVDLGACRIEWLIAVIKSLESDIDPEETGTRYVFLEVYADGEGTIKVQEYTTADKHGSVVDTYVAAVFTLDK